MSDVVLNKYDEPATHDDCISGGGLGCSGDMRYSENINTGRSFLMCAHHADQHATAQQRIHAEYLNDTVPEDAQ
jgi:hypothetical protein